MSDQQRTWLEAQITTVTRLHAESTSVLMRTGLVTRLKNLRCQLEALDFEESRARLRQEAGIKERAEKATVAMAARVERFGNRVGSGYLHAEGCEQVLCVYGCGVELSAEDIAGIVVPTKQVGSPSDTRDSTIGLFHRLWTKAVGTDDYDKSEWMALETALLGALGRSK